MVVGGHVADSTPIITYASVYSIDTFHNDLAISALYYLVFKVSGIMNSCVTDPVTEKIWTILGPYFDGFYSDRFVWTEEFHIRFP